MPNDGERSFFAQLGRRGLVERMHEQLDELMAARDQMEQLLHLNVEIGFDLGLDRTLQRIVHAAISLTGARYGALGMRASDGTLASFHYAGIDADAERRIGHLPVGKGLLGVLLDRTEALRLDDLTQHPAAVGFPEHHPPMRAFLGVPITMREAVLGSLYLADDRPEHGFSESDETAARALAAAAAVAIDNAQLFDLATTSAQWVTASREITTALLSGTQTRPLQLIAERAQQLTDAEQAIVLIPVDSELPATDIDTLVVATAVGMHAGEVIGLEVRVDGSTSGEVFRTGQPVITDAFRHPIPGFTDVGQRPAVVAPLRAGDAVLGVIAVARNQHRRRFDSSYLDLLSDFANHAAIALQLGSAHLRERELVVLADRERIAHDLHDHVIQKLFAAGMDLQGSIARARSPELVDRLTRTVDDLQTTIEDIRTTIFRLQHRNARAGDFQQRIQHVIGELTDDRDIATTLRISGPVSIIDGELADHTEAVITEAISNTIRHSGASELTIEIAVVDQLTIDIIDNGRGIPADNQRCSGLANMSQRAQQLGGTFQITTPAGGGTHLRWAASLIGP